MRSQLRGIRRVAVDLDGIEGFLEFAELKGLARPLPGGNAAVEATAVAHMAAGTGARHLDPHPDGVLVVIDAQVFHFLHESAGGAFVPQALPAATPVKCLTGGDGFFESLRIHIGMHEQLPGMKIRGNDGNDAIGVKFRGELAAFFDLFDCFAFVK